MKIAGIARKVDHLGRIVLPVEMRRQLGISAGDELDITLDEGAVLMRKVEVGCTFCGGTRDLREYRERQVCAECAAALSAI